MKKNQQKFVFKKDSWVFRPEGYEPIAHFSAEDELKEMILMQGYLVNKIRRKKGYILIYQVAKANVSVGERRKLQKQIDANPLVFSSPYKLPNQP